MKKKEEFPNRVDLETIDVSYQRLSPEEFKNYINKTVDHIVKRYEKTHSDIKLEIVDDTSNCYYEGDPSRPVLEVTGIKNV